MSLSDRSQRATCRKQVDSPVSGLCCGVGFMTRRGRYDVKACAVVPRQLLNKNSLLKQTNKQTSRCCWALPHCLGCSSYVFSASAEHLGQALCLVLGGASSQEGKQIFKLRCTIGNNLQHHSSERDWCSHDKNTLA